ncbi:MFS transporter [Mycobacterium sp. BMJ-28]
MPLACVLLAADVVDSYAIGGMMAGGYAAGEALLAPIMGRRAQEGRLRRELAVAVSAEAIFIVATLSVIAWRPGWWPLAVATMAAAGGVASGVPGALRSYIASATDVTMRDQALSIDNIISQACWLIGPTLAALGAAVDPWAPLVIVAVGLVFTLPALARLTGSPRHDDLGEMRTSPIRLARTLLTPVVVSAVIMATLAALDVLLPAHIAVSGAPQVLSGLILAGLAAVSMSASAIYGMRRWPGTPWIHSQAGILTMGVLMTIIGLSAELLWLSLALCVLIGAAEAPALLGRNIALTTQLPERDWTVGFSLLYSAGGIGYTVGSTVAGQLVDRMTAASAFATVGIAVLAAGTVVTAAEHRSQRTQRHRSTAEAGAGPAAV